MENLLNVCKVMYRNFEIDIYDEPWSQGDEFLLFRLNGNYIGRIHKYQLCDMIKNDFIIKKFLSKLECNYFKFSLIIDHLDLQIALQKFDLSLMVLRLFLFDLSS